MGRLIDLHSKIEAGLGTLYHESHLRFFVNRVNDFTLCQDLSFSLEQGLVFGRCASYTPFKSVWG